jgi:diguanylate cyclase (GGDEF)-like protein
MTNTTELFLDGLTGLYNRAYFMDRLSEAADAAQDKRHALALLLIDLDNLFLINHERGRPAGDLALQALADALRRSAHDHQTVARLAGDQFAMLLPGTALATATQFARAIRSLIGRAHEVRPGFGAIDVCIGVAARPLRGSWDATDLLQLADLRLNSAKRSRHRPGHEQPVWAGPPDMLDGDDAEGAEDEGGSDER